jgi:two-component system, OmpR family, response regulator VicR
LENNKAFIENKNTSGTLIIGKGIIVEAFHVIFADDDLDIHHSVQAVLAQNSIEMSCVFDGRQALDLWALKPADLFLLDRVMPVMDGLTALKNIRLVSNIPVILLTALASEEQIVEGFEAGASDYILKPFRNRELVARIKACLRKGRVDEKTLPGRLEYAGLNIDLHSQRIFCQNKEVKVSHLEFQLLAYLMSHAGMVVSKQDLLKNVWGYFGEEVDLNMIEAAMARMRKKFQPDKNCIQYIHTVRGSGYRFGGD